LALAPVFERAIARRFRDPIPARGLGVVPGAKCAFRREIGGASAEEALVGGVLGDDGSRIDARESGEHRSRIVEAPAPHPRFRLEPLQQMIVRPPSAISSAASPPDASSSSMTST
jgi:hypothetical protein